MLPGMWHSVLQCLLLPSLLCSSCSHLWGGEEEEPEQKLAEAIAAMANVPCSPHYTALIHRNTWADSFNLLTQVLARVRSITNAPSHNLHVVLLKIPTAFPISFIFLYVEYSANGIFRFMMTSVRPSTRTPTYQNSTRKSCLKHAYRGNFVKSFNFNFIYYWLRYIFTSTKSATDPAEYAISLEIIADGNIVPGLFITRTSAAAPTL